MPNLVAAGRNNAKTLHCTHTKVGCIADSPSLNCMTGELARQLEIGSSPENIEPKIAPAESEAHTWYTYSAGGSFFFLIILSGKMNPSFYFGLMIKNNLDKVFILKTGFEGEFVNDALDSELRNN